MQHNIVKKFCLESNPKNEKGNFLLNEHQIYKNEIVLFFNFHNYDKWTFSFFFVIYWSLGWKLLLFPHKYFILTRALALTVRPSASTSQYDRQAFVNFAIIATNTQMKWFRYTQTLLDTVTDNDETEENDKTNVPIGF